MKQKIIALAVLGLPAVALAADGGLLDEIVVTATRTARTADESLQSVTVISRKAIEQSQARSLPELLAGVPGLSIVSNGGAGKATSVFLRGANDDHVLVLIDGVKVGSATTGKAAFQDIPLDQIERVEIVRGPRSTLYGSGAIGGVIQIFTRQVAKAVSASAGAGSQDTRRLSASLSGLSGEVSWRMSASHFYTDGINVRPAHPDKDEDGYENNALSLALNWQLDADHRLAFDWMRAQGKNEYDGGSTKIGAHGESVQQVAGVAIHSRLAGHWQSTLRLGQSLDASDDWASATATSKTSFDTRRNSVSWQNDFTLGRDLLTLGLDAVDDRVSSTTNYATKSRMEKAAFGQYQFGLGQHELIAGLRRLDNEQFGGHTTGNLDWGYDLGNGLRLRAGYGTAFKAPTFNQLYYPDIGFYKGNPDLRPETSETREVGLRSGGGWITWDVSLFRTDVENLIAGWYPPINTAQARMAGGEAGLGLSLAGWQLRTTVSHVDTEDRATGKRLARRPQWSGRFDADRAFGRNRFGISVYGQDGSFDDAANAVAIDGFAVVDLRFERAIDDRFSLQAKAGNLFDQSYETASGYASPGRTFFIGLNYRD